MMQPEANSQFDGHEEVIGFADEALGCAGIIAIHSTVLGPSAGGCRIWTYADDDAALTDVLRLSRGMTYKNTMADLPLGGGKAVIYRPAAPDQRAAMFMKLGEVIESLGGRYITAEDVGANVADMKNVARATQYVTGVPHEAGRAGGDPSPWTSLGVFLSIERLLGGNVRGKRVAVQGVGAVGFGLAELLHKADAKLIVSDVSRERLDRAAALGAEITPADRIHAAAADVFAPCALGAGLNGETIPELGAPIVCGAANNQLLGEADGARLLARGVTYAPDYIVNAGGIINVSGEYLGESVGAVEARVRAIPDRLILVLEEAKRGGVSPHVAADAIVRRRLAEARAAKGV